MIHDFIEFWIPILALKLSNEKPTQFSESMSQFFSISIEQLHCDGTDTVFAFLYSLAMLLFGKIIGKILFSLPVNANGMLFSARKIATLIPAWITCTKNKENK